MKDQDFQLEAVKAFPVWPEGATHILEYFGNLNAAKKTELGMLEIKLDLGYFDQAYWQIACTREQHIRLRMEFFEGAHHDAEFISLEDANNHQAWWKKKGCQLFIICEEGDIYEWEHSDIDKNRLIPRPTKEELAYIAELDGVKESQWQNGLPPVGVECEATFGTKKNWYKFVIAGDFGFILIGDYWQRKLVSEYEGIEFRPLKTEADKERDRVVGMAWDGVNFELGAFDSAAHYLEFLGQLYDNGMLVDPNK